MNDMTDALRAKPSRNEELKQASPTLAGTISATLADPALDRFSDDDCEFLKFHGIYQSDDRDKRKTAKHYMSSANCARYSCASPKHGMAESDLEISVIA